MCDGTITDYCTVDNLVRQGCVLTLTLFITCMNHVLRKMSNGTNHFKIKNSRLKPPKTQRRELWLVHLSYTGNRRFRIWRSRAVTGRREGSKQTWLPKVERLRVVVAVRDGVGRMTTRCWWRLIALEIWWDECRAFLGCTL